MKTMLFQCYLHAYMCETFFYLLDNISWCQAISFHQLFKIKISAFKEKSFIFSFFFV